MNEEELKKLWRKEEAIPLKSIDMEFIQQYTLNTQNSLRKISKTAMIVGLIASAIFVLDFIYSGNFYLVLSAMAGVWIYVIWDSRRKAKLDEVNRTENVKKYLIGKEKKLKREIILCRISTFFGTTVFAFLMNRMEGSIHHPGDSPLTYIIFLVITAIIVQIGCELYVRLNYYPILEDLRYLIEELNGEDDNNRQ